MTRTRRIRLAVGLVTAAAVTGCSDSDGGDLGGPDPAVRTAARAEPSGNGQSGTAGQDLASPLRIVVLRGSTPEAGAVVNWSATGTGAFMTPKVDTTGSDGISTSAWHLGDEPGPQTSQAAVAGGADGAPVAFTATAEAPDGDDPPPPPPPPPPSAVEIQLLTSGGNRFEPANVTIPAGTTVTWTWVGGFHDVTATGTPAFPSSGAPVGPPETFSHTFNTPGTYLYFCSVHGSPTDGMRGTIVVQ
jgi:plastocyanin